MAITITDLGRDGCQIAFSYDKALVAALKERFPKARWSQNLKAWCVPGPLAYRRAMTWAGEVEDVQRAVDKARELERRDADFDGRLAEVDPAAALAARRAEFQSTRIRIEGDVVLYNFQYDPRCVEIAKGSGARFDATTKTWSWRVDAVAEVDAIIAAANRIFALRMAAVEQVKRAKAETAARIAAERAERDAHRFEARGRRFAVLADGAPAPGATLRHGRDIVTVETLGKAFRAGDDLSSMGGPIGCDGEWVRYAYYRPATPQETAALETREAAARAAAERARARRAAIDTVARSADAPHVGAAPEGETIWLDDRSRATGYERRVVLTPDGWLWHIVYDGSDGAAWGDYNCGYNTRGARVPATPELVAAIGS